MRDDKIFIEMTGAPSGFISVYCLKTRLLSCSYVYIYDLSCLELRTSIIWNVNTSTHTV